MKQLKLKTPHLPILNDSPSKTFAGLYGGMHVGIRAGITGRRWLIHSVICNGEQEKPVIGAGRGGVHYGKKSAMERIAENGTKIIRRRKK